MKEERRKGNLKYLFSLADMKPAGWYGAIGFSIAGILLEAFPYAAIYFITRQVLELYAAGGSLADANSILWGLLTLLTLCSSILCTLTGGYRAHKYAFELIYRLRRRILSHLGTLSMGYFTSTSTGEIQKLMEHSMGKIEQLMAHNIPNLIGAGPLLVVLLASMFLLNGWLALAVLLPVILAFLIQTLSYGNKKSRQMTVEMSRRMGEMTRRFNEYLRGIAVIKIFGGRNNRYENLSKSISDYLKTLLHFTKMVSIPSSAFKVIMLSLLTFVMPIATILIVLYGGELRLVLTILMFLIITPCLYSPILELIRLGVETQMAQVAVDQIEKLMELQPLPEPASPKIPPSFDVHFENVSFSYQDASDPMRRWALQEVSFTAPAGSVTALAGPSGGGKSTTGQLLCRFWDVSTGAIRIGGVDIRDMALTTLMDVIAFVFQDTFLFSDTVYQNIAMHREVSQSEGETAARAAMCHDFIMELPQGYQTRLGDGGHPLSGGEAQRIAIARAILKDSPVIVLDEATAYTDADNETLIQQALSRLLKGKTVLMIAHRLATVQNARQILLLKDGQIAECGTHQSLLLANGLYAHLWQIQNESGQWILQGGHTNENMVE
ncbi:MAG: ABC transporter ATP-binding protein [Lachnospiraceae bacterium]